MMPLERAPQAEPAKWVAIVDDHASMRASLVRAFRLERIPTTAFASAAEYLRHAAPSAPSCLLLDMQLPDMNGLHLLQLLDRAHPPLPPTIVISGHEDLLKALEGNALVRGWLHKPFDFAELLELVRPFLTAEEPARRSALGPSSVAL